VRRVASLLLGLVLAAGPVAGQARLYVANQDDATVAVIDLATNRLLETVDLGARGFGPHARPHHTQVEPDGAHWYVTLITAGKVLKLDRENRIKGSVDLDVPGLLALHPSEDLLVVARSMSAVNPPSRIALIRPSDMTLLDEVEIFFPRPHALVVDPRGTHAYVASLGVNQIGSVRLADGQLSLTDVDGPHHTLTQFAVSPDARWLVATAETSNRLLVWDISEPGVPRFARDVVLEAGPFEPVFTWDASRVFVTNLNADAVTVLDPATWETVAVLRHPTFRQPHGVALSPDGRYVYVSSRHQSGGAHDHEGHRATGHGTVAAICIPALSVDAVIEVGHYAAGMGAPAPPAPPTTPPSCR
jgi:YVTN family beta-propeller protein